MQIPIELKFKYKSAEDLVIVGSKVTLQNCLDMPKQVISSNKKIRQTFQDPTTTNHINAYTT